MFLGCSDCRNKFDNLRSLNKHISKTGHEKGMKIDSLYAIKMIVDHISLGGCKISIKQMIAHQKNMEAVLS